MSKVAIVKTPVKPSEREIDIAVRKAIELSGSLSDIISPGDTVLIKPNLVTARPPGSGVITDPRICKVIANMVREIGARAIIAESSGVGSDTEKAIQAAGYGKLREEGYRVIDLKKEETTKVPVPRGKAMKEVRLPKIVVDANAIISVPVMKTHDETMFTLALKNMKGVLPDAFKKKFHITFGLMQAIVDLMTVVKPTLSVVDGIIAMEGLGPVAGDPVEMDLVIAGRDPVAVDAVTGAVMGFEPEECEYVRIAAKSEIGTAELNKIEVIGEPIASVRRRFKRFEEALSEDLSFPQDFKLLLADKACSGCRSTVLVALRRLDRQNHLDRAAGWTVVAGRVDNLPNAHKEKLLLVGACTTKFRKKGVFLKGCPVEEHFIASAISGEEYPVWWDAR